MHDGREPARGQQGDGIRFRAEHHGLAHRDRRNRPPRELLRKARAEHVEVGPLRHG